MAAHAVYQFLLDNAGNYDLTDGPTIMAVLQPEAMRQLVSDADGYDHDMDETDNIVTMVLRKFIRNNEDHFDRDDLVKISKKAKSKARPAKAAKPVKAPAAKPAKVKPVMSDAKIKATISDIVETFKNTNPPYDYDASRSDQQEYKEEMYDTIVDTMAAKDKRFTRAMFDEKYKDFAKAVWKGIENEPVDVSRTWLAALKLWNSDKEMWCIPKKGTSQYAEVRALMGPPKPKKARVARVKKTKVPAGTAEERRTAAAARATETMRTLLDR